MLKAYLPQAIPRWLVDKQLAGVLLASTGTEKWCQLCCGQQRRRHDDSGLKAWPDQGPTEQLIWEMDNINHSGYCTWCHPTTKEMSIQNWWIDRSLLYNQLLMDPPLVLLDSPFFTKINTVHGPLQRHHTTNCADCGSCWTMRLKEFWSHAFHFLIPVNPCFAGRFHQGAIHKLIWFKFDVDSCLTLRVPTPDPESLWSGNNQTSRDLSSCLCNSTSRASRGYIQSRSMFIYRNRQSDWGSCEQTAGGSGKQFRPQIS